MDWDGEVLFLFGGGGSCNGGDRMRLGRGLGDYDLLTASGAFDFRARARGILVHKVVEKVLVL